MVGEKLTVDIEEDNANDPMTVALRMHGIAVSHIPKLVHWLPVSTITHDGRQHLYGVLFATQMLAMCSHTSIPHTLIDYIAKFYIPIFEN